MIANAILTVFSLGTILLFARVRINSKNIAKIKKTPVEPDERVGKHGREISELEKNLKKSNTEMVNLTKRIAKVEGLVKSTSEHIKVDVKRIVTLEKKVERLSR